MKNPKKMHQWLPVLLLAATLALGLPFKAQACGGGGGMDHGAMDHSSMGMGSSGHMGQGYGSQGSYGNMGQGQMGPGMMGRAGAPAGAWSQAAPGSTGSGHMGATGSVDHSQMGHGGPGTGR